MYVQQQKQISESFAKQTVIFDTSDQYNPRLAVDFLNARMGLLNGIKEGMTLEVWVDINSRQSTKDESQYFTNVTGWKVEQIHGAPSDEIVKEEEEEFNSDALPF